MLRLLERARSHSADPELFAGLVQACRYAGLDRPAIAAYEHARRLDPQVRTAVTHAYFTAGDYEKAIETDLEDPPIITALAMDLLGRRAEAVELLERFVVPGLPTLFQLIIDASVALFEGNMKAALPAADAMLQRWPMRDACATYYLARTLAAARHPRAIEIFRRAVEGGFHSYSCFTRDPWLDSLRGEPAFAEVMALAEKEYREALDAFVIAGGDHILGIAHA
jgi:tetratricopeptide (TPR) repeat protein